MKRVVAAFLPAVVLAGCAPSGPPTTDTTSDHLPALAARVEFLARYFSLPGECRELDFHIRYQNNNGGMVPGPSDADIRVVAVVPPGELNAWIPPGATRVPTPADGTAWLATVPNGGRAAGVTEWHAAPGTVVGLDRAAAVVAYRHWTR